MKAARLPRKLKKQVKKKVAKKTASKMAMSAIVTAQARAQCAMIAATPHGGPAGIATKALSVVKTVSNAAKAIQNIMSEPPNSWKDFIKQS